MKVLSLFDGISCGMVALERAEIEVERYVAYEIEESAIKISKKNYPHIEHCGDVFKADFNDYKGFDLLIGGSPCTFWSVAQKSDRRETVSEGFGWELFQQYVRALNESGCKYFIYENNKSMSDAIKAEITKHLGVEPLLINSALVSAQNRNRYYWTNIPRVTVPEDKGIILQDILESGHVDRKKSLCVARRYAGFSGSQSYFCRRYFGKSFGQAVFEGDIEKIKQQWKDNPYFESDELNARQMTIKECERLQTLPDDYTNVEGVSAQMRYEAIGNGWTVDVIAHILSYIKTEKEKKEMELIIKEMSLPEAIEFNFDELKQELTDKVSHYSSLVYGEEEIKAAKADVANLRKFTKLLSDERIKVKKQVLKPYEAFESKVAELTSIVNEPISVIDQQVKTYEEQQKADKQQKILDYWESIETPDGLALEEIFDQKWLNASTSMKSIQDAITGAIAKFCSDMLTLSNLPEFAFEARQTYISCLDIGKALNEAHRLSELAKAKAEHEANLQKEIAEKVVQEVPIEVAAVEEVSDAGFIPSFDEKKWYTYDMHLQMNQVLEVEQLLKSNGIPFRYLGKRG